ncbi:hypothetical protein ACFOS0_30975 [Nocardia seriolae]|uniref:Uncharacterized protein n=1 Tax=Nocardia seriolae TaxID=37332 RepID=A0ABC9Z367_9NOCA|nr:hypothetical protein [Nocardia seriolae]BEK97753.1 hypothetical protein NSER024013_56590 [Nocardia seriolae]GAM49928.1 hypothetical protein NS07_v2contig00129-0008 [Nocardia seriolae]GAP31941.1 hypothetical protein NSK11_contig00134-0010 [Nocardia seriolae]GEM27620.1 hypothetical protein NS2_58590 [Nocardia seriolae NBRC 15557]
MRTFVHLLLFAAAIAVAVGVFGPLVGTVDARNVQFDDLRSGFASGGTLDQLGSHSGAFPTSLAIGLLGVAAAVLLAALFGARTVGWVGVLVGLAGLGVLAWRLDDRFDHELRTDWKQLLNGAWGLYLVGGGLVLSLLLLLVPRERRLPPPPPRPGL